MRKKVIVGGLVIVALLVLVAGATYAIFSDNIASDEQTFAAGTVNIQVDGQDESFVTTLHMPNMEPGDCATQTVRVANVGTLPVDLWNWIYTSGEIFGCDPNPACNMYVKKTLVLDNTVPEEKLHTGGDFEDYELEACLPLCAGNLCQTKAGKFRLFFHAVQQSNLEGWECVKLEDKDTTFWMPDPTTPQHGNICYKQDGGDLHVVVNAYKLTPDACFQLALDGGDVNDPNDGACTTQDDNLANMSGDIYEAGYWNWGTYLEASCDPNSGEGVYNYAGVYEPDKVCADSDGNISWGGTITGLPSLTYVVKANVKEISNQWPGDDWTGVLSGLDYLSFTIP